MTGFTGFREQSLPAVRPDAHYFSIGGETRNEARHGGKKRAFIGRFEDFGLADGKLGEKSFLTEYLTAKYAKHFWRNGVLTET
jgi:hypothetical protein